MASNSRLPKILFLDIEASNLNANFGIMLCFGYKWLGDKNVTIIGVDDFPSFKKDKSDDSGVARAARDVILEADLVVAHYGDWGRFDLPFINARMLAAGLAPLPTTIPYVDTWRAARKYLKLNSNRLGTVAEHLGVEEEKTAIKQREWVRAMGGDKKALKYVKHHCVLDVQILEKVYLKLRPLMTNHPNMALVGGAMDVEEAFFADLDECPCPRCGEEGFLQRRGSYACSTGRKIRFMCDACGSWSSSKPIMDKTVVAR